MIEKREIQGIEHTIGFDASARLTEIISHEAGFRHLVVFHAMPCRKDYVPKLARR